MKRVAIVGAGGMGTALAAMLARSGSEVRLWARDAARAEALNATRENARHLPGVALPEGVVATHDAERACRGADLLIAAVPSAYLRATLAALAGAVERATPVLSVVKGIESGTFARPSRIIEETLGSRSVAILSGPSHAEEIARGLPASVVVAGTDARLNVAARDALNSDRFRVYTNDDAVGVELAGALKNVLGLAAGVCEGLGFGDNAKAALLTRGLAEIVRFGLDQGAEASTFFGLAGVGDLLTTCYSGFGRNRRVGIRIGRGEPLELILREMVDVAEGVSTTRGVREQARLRGVEMPITEELHAVLFEGNAPRAAVSKLMDRLPREEWRL